MFVVPVVVFCLLATVVASNALAYLSLQRPSSYHRLLAMPQKAWHRIIGPGEDAIDPVAASSESGTAADPQVQTR